MLDGPARDMFLTQPPCRRVELRISWESTLKSKDTGCGCTKRCFCRLEDIRLRRAFQRGKWVAVKDDGVRFRDIAQAVRHKGWDTFGIVHDHEVLIDIPDFLHEDSVHVVAALSKKPD